MKQKPIYVETVIMTEMDRLWSYTQTPELHQQWDLRFSEIHYLPRDRAEFQRFLYKTRIGLGLEITGIGVTREVKQQEHYARMSVLKFGSDQQISLIRKGGGYWRYHDNGSGCITFITKYDYQTRFGLLGAWFDKLLFRPMFGAATAWSFDVLRLWLEKGIPPAASISKAIIHAVSVGMLFLLWCYEGVVPKLLFPEAGELDLLRQTGWFGGQEGIAIGLLGMAEIGIGFMTIWLHKSRLWYSILGVLLFSLMLGALITDPGLLQAPFNPVTLSGSMIAFCIMPPARLPMYPAFIDVQEHRHQSK
ncbi:DoxX-like family protein [Paenibacillus sp. JCM 10914]|uniref:DoxX-like family protein n=1 Tax=Paenibacillus sp. JCM 10914 TaxID=1236974 RepID=UPI0003CC7CF6|nr:DoxX-like family protein [Paenibacillus sp. JCM 10914]GAE04973.1 hypothetical protein JCM10914_1050 [Paenibacillus sp. JCM 10914]